MKRYFIITALIMGCSTSINWKDLILSTMDIAYPLIREAVTDGLSSMDASSGDASISDVSADRE